MKIGVCIATKDEGYDLEATVALLRASEPPIADLVVVDDASRHPVSLRLPKEDVRRLLQVEGPGRAKAFGANLLANKCDVVVVSDAHMRMPKDWVQPLVDAVAKYPNSAFCFNCRGFERGSTFSGYGAQWAPEERGMRLVWRGRPKTDETTPLVPGLMGGFYAFPSHLWQALEGFNPSFQGWGLEEEDASYRLWMMGYETRCIVDVPVLHNFKREIAPGHPSSWQVWFNKAVCEYCSIEDEAAAQARADRTLNDPAVSGATREEWTRKLDRIKLTRARFQATRKRSDAELLDVCGFGVAKEAIAQSRSREVQISESSHVPKHAARDHARDLAAGKSVRLFGASSLVFGCRDSATSVHFVTRLLQVARRAGVPSTVSADSTPAEFALIGSDKRVDVLIVDESNLSAEDAHAIVAAADKHVGRDGQVHVL